MLQLIREHMRYGVLQIQVKNGMWFVTCTIIGPDKIVEGNIHTWGKQLEPTLNESLIKTKNDYESLIEKLKHGRQVDLDFEK